MSDKIKVTERIFVKDPLGRPFKVLAHRIGDEITAARAAQIGVGRNGKLTKSSGKATKVDEPKAADEDANESKTDEGKSDPGDVQTAEVRSGKPGTTKKAS